MYKYLKLDRLWPWFTVTTWRWVIGGLLVVVAGWLLWVTVWQPLHGDIVLPEGILAQDPRLNIDLLNQLLTESSKRSASSASDFARAVILFVP